MKFHGTSLLWADSSHGALKRRFGKALPRRREGVGLSAPAYLRESREWDKSGNWSGQRDLNPRHPA
ncbi:MAG TPA: hypothetical protein P5057_10485, partial [Acidobacteriota bacterium]|nr:hypothetical protein [Acidobacteriota bacterium]